MSRALKTLESGILRPDGFQGRWMVWQNTEALLLHRYTSKHRMEEVKVSVETNSYIIFGPGRNHVSKKLGTAGHGTVNKPAVLFITCKLPLGYSDEGEIDFDTYTMWIDLQRDLYNTSAIKIEESNQVLKITVPKLKPEWIHKAGIKWDYRSRLAS
ncbi:hypothetical protein QVD17_04886 [Tagetes erecta]|uniref:Uncharacterized protein n=1 Tax=Tagetes erecta TaxID=13708 RepID=A0AAD8LH54_TARER|nr:hypothetical protein QVD17_04886 [Tagetes erecta]